MMTKNPYLVLVLLLTTSLLPSNVPRAHGQTQEQSLEVPRIRNPTIDQFLAVEDFSRFTSNVEDHLDGLVQSFLREGDVETPKRVLEHLVKLKTEARKEDHEKFKNPSNATDATWFLTKINRHGSNVEARLALTLDILRNPIQGQEAELERQAFDNLHQTMVRRFYLEIENVPGEAGRLKAFQDYCGYLSRAIGGRLCSILGPLFSELYANFSEREIYRIITWLETERAGPLAKELAMAARLRIAVQAEADPDAELSTEQRYYIFVLSDSTLPVSWRLETARRLVTLLGDRIHSELVMNIGKLLADEWNSPVVRDRNWHAATLLKAYLSIQRNRPDEWLSLGKAIGDGWLSSRLEAVDNPLDSTELPYDEVLQALRLVLATKNREVLDRMPSELFRLSRVAPLLLIQTGETDHAINVIQSQWKGFLPDPLPDGPHYSEAMESQLKLCLTSIDGEGLKYFTEVLVKSVPDSEEIEEGLMPRSERLRLLAERFEKVSFEDPGLQLKSLSFLVIEPSTAEALAAPILELAKGLDLEAVEGLDRSKASEERKMQFGLAADHVMNAVALKDPRPIMHYLKQAMRANVDETESSEPLMALARGLLIGLSNSWTDWDAEDIGKFVPALETLFSNPRTVLYHSYYPGGRGPDFGYAFIAFLTSNTMSVLEALYERVDEDAQFRMRQSTYMMADMLSILATTYAGSPDHDPESRYDLFYSMLAHPLVDKSSLNSWPSIVAKAIDLGVLTPDKVIEKAEALIELIPQSVKTAEAVASALTEKGDIEGALSYWDQAIASIHESYTSERSRLIFGKVKSLENGGRDEEALWTLVAENWKRTLTPQTVYEQRLDALHQRRTDAGISEDPIELTTRRIRQGSDHPFAQIALAALYELRGDRSREGDDMTAALSDYRFAIDLMGDVSEDDMALADHHVLLLTKIIDARVALGEVPEPVSLVSVASEWRFSDEATDLGDGWRTPQFDDADWRSGKGRFGYAGDEVTHVNFGEKSSRKTPTTYFRHSFESDLDPAGIAKLRLRLLRDDGAVVYLNSEEVLRAQMPEGEIVYETRATASTSGADDDRYFEYLIDVQYLQKGNNLLAVEIHQASSSTSDFGFDLSLDALAEIHLERE